MSEFNDKKSNTNINNINSSYIIKNVFSFISYKRKLELVIYNKVIQKNY